MWRVTREHPRSAKCNRNKTNARHVDEIPQMCPRCKSSLTLLQGWLPYCAVCGFEGAPPNISLEGSAQPSPSLFWFLLVTPALLGLLGFLVGPGRNHDPGMAFFSVGIGLVALPLVLASSFYCGLWLVRHFSSPDSLNLLMTFLVFFALAGLNLMIVVGGCAAGFRVVGEFRDVGGGTLW
jgi:hypothetical protein